MLACASIDALDPQRLEVTLLLLAPAVDVLQCLLHAHAADAPHIASAPAEAFGQLKHTILVKAHDRFRRDQRRVAGCCRRSRSSLVLLPAL
jgi:hypothetical protein